MITVQTLSSQRRPPSRASRVSVPLLGTIGLLVVIFGIGAASGEFTLVALVGGLGIGVALVAQPTLLLWLALLWTLILAGLLQYFAGVSRADWPAYAMAAAFWLLALVAPKHGKQLRGENRLTPVFLVELAAFFVLAIGNTIYQFDGIAQFVIGLKNYVLFFGLTLAIGTTAYSLEMLRRTSMAILAIGLLQLPVTLYQYIFVRASRVSGGGFGLGDSLVEASDSVVGTLGGNMYGGGLDDVLALLVFILIAGMLAAWANSLIRLRSALIVIVALLIPVLLAETKVIFVYLPIVVLVALWDNIRRRPHWAFLMAFALPVVFGAGLMGYYYLHWSQQYSSPEAAIEHTFSYSFADSVGADRARLGDMTRKQAIVYWWSNHGLDKPDLLLFGHGMASSKLHSTVSIPTTVMQNGGLNLAKSGFSQLLWDTGVLGTLLFFVAAFSASALAGHLAKQVKELWDRVILKAIQAGLLMVMASLLYRNSALNMAQAGFLLFFMLGLVANYSQISRKGTGDLLDSRK